MEIKPKSSNRKAKNQRDGHQAVNPALTENALRTKSDKYPDPTVLTASERLAEFGKLMLRAVERRAAKRCNSDHRPDESKTQQLR